MNQLQLFLPCAAGVEALLADEVLRITGVTPQSWRGGVLVEGSWRDAMRLNLHSRLAQRVLVHLSTTPYRNENDLYQAASDVAWEIWFTPKQSFKIEITAQHSPLKSLNFAALKIKDAIADRFRFKTGVRPDVETRWPDARVYVHLTNEHLTLYIDTSGEALFKRGWRADKGDAPLKETLAAAMLAASGWDAQTPLYDPCCGSGTIAIEAAQIACHVAPGLTRRFGFEKLLPFQPHVWSAIKQEAENDVVIAELPLFGSDVSHRMVDFASRNAERAGVGRAVQFRGGDALQRLAPCEQTGLIVMNPPYGERINAAGFSGRESAQFERDEDEGGDEGHARHSGARSGASSGVRSEGGGDDGGDEFFRLLAAHWKKNYNGWTAWVLTPDLKLPGRMRMKESRRVPLWNGPIECRLFRFVLTLPPPRKPTGDLRVPAQGD